MNISFIFPSYIFIIVGLIVGLFVALVTAAMISDTSCEHPILTPIVVFSVIAGVFLILNLIQNQNNRKQNTLKISEAISVSEQRCGERLSNVNAYIDERNNTLINLADIVKSYDKYEGETLIEIVKAKSGMSYTAILSEVNEKYPQLRSIENYAKLISKLDETETNLRKARTDYNQAVKDYNSIISNKFYTDYIKATGQYAPKEYLESDVTGNYESVRIMKE